MCKAWDLERGEMEIAANILEIEVLNDYVVIITEKEKINFNLENLEQINIKKTNNGLTIINVELKKLDSASI